MSQNQVVLDHDGHNYHYQSFGSYFPMPIKIVGGALALIGVFMLIQFDIESLIRGAIFLFIGSMFVLTTYGIEFDADHIRSRIDYKYLFLKRKKKWVSVSNAQYISVFGATMKQVVGSRAQPDSMAIKSKELQINIIHNRNKRLLVFKSDDLNELYAKADELSAQTGLRIHDALNKRPT